MVYMGVCRACVSVCVCVYMCARACVLGSVDIWSPQAVGVIGQALFFVFWFFWLVCVFVLSKNRVVFRNKLHCKLLPAHMREQVPALENAGKMYHVLKEIQASPALESPGRMAHTGQRMSLAWWCPQWSPLHPATPTHPSIPSCHWRLWSAFPVMDWMSFGTVCQNRRILVRGEVCGRREQGVRGHHALLRTGKLSVLCCRAIQIPSSHV